MEEREKPVNAGKPWTEEDMFFVGSFAPTWRNICWLADRLGRTPHAVQYLLCKMYCKTTDLKEWAKVDTSKSEQAIQKRINMSTGKQCFFFDEHVDFLILFRELE